MWDEGCSSFVGCLSMFVLFSVEYPIEGVEVRVIESKGRRDSRTSRLTPVKVHQPAPLGCSTNMVAVDCA